MVADEKAPPAMDVNDPNLMVTIAATRIGKLTYPNDPGWSRTSPGRELRNGYDTDNLICAVLEAIACLSVYSDREQVVAVALQVNIEANTAIITVAQNEKVPDNVIKHIDWLLAVLGKAAAAYEALKEDDKKSHNLKGTFPIEIIKMRTYALIDVYRYSILKNWRRYLKWFDRLECFLELLKTKGHMIEHSQQILETLGFCMNDLFTILGNKDGKGDLASNQWERLIDTMDTIIPLTGHFYNHCEEFATAPDASAWETEWRRVKAANDEKATEDANEKPWTSNAEDGIKSFPVRHAVGKLTSQHRYMRNLFNDATSFSLKHLFSCKFTVRPADMPPEVRIRLPGDAGELKLIVETMYKLRDPKVSVYVTNPVVDRITSKFTLPDNGAESVVGVVHCECALVAHFERIGQKIRDEKDDKTRQKLIADEPAPFNYLGVSKLSCGACHSWLRAFNLTTTHGLKYYTAGTHSMWYPLWAMPPSLLTAELKGKMANLVCQRFVRYCKPEAAEEAQPVEGTGSAFAGTWRGTRG